MAGGVGGLAGDAGLLKHRLPTLELDAYRWRVSLMTLAALSALAVDFASKNVVVAMNPDTLLFNVSDRMPFGLGSEVILVAAASSLLACVLPVRMIAIGAGLALGGSLGNLTSRHWWGDLGGSPDFIPFADGSTGNVADLAIAAGAGGMLLGAVAWTLLTTFGAAR